MDVLLKMRKNGVVELVSRDPEKILLTNFPTKFMGLDLYEEREMLRDAKEVRVVVSLLDIIHAVDFEDMQSWQKIETIAQLKTTATNFFKST